MITNNCLYAALAIQPLLIVVLVIHGYRLSRYLNSSISTLRGIESNSLSSTLGLFMPARTGELIKALYIGHKEGISFPQATGAILLERVFDLLFFILLSFIILLGAGIEGDRTYLMVFSVLLFSIIIFITCYLIIGEQTISFLRRLGFKFVPDFMELNLQGIKLALKNAFGFKILSAGLMAWVFTFFSYALFFHFALPGNTSFLILTTLFIAGTIGMGLGVTPGSLGTFESALGVVLFNEGFHLNQTFWVLLCFRVAMSLPTACIALVVLFKNRSLIRKLKEKVKFRHKVSESEKAAY